jgi:hypothetical protein
MDCKPANSFTAVVPVFITTKYGRITGLICEEYGKLTAGYSDSSDLFACLDNPNVLGHHPGTYQARLCALTCFHSHSAAMTWSQWAISGSAWRENVFLTSERPARYQCLEAC